MHHHHLHQHHSRFLPHNKPRNLHFHYLVETEIISNLEFKVFDQSISIVLDHLKHFKNSTLGLILDIKAHFKCTNFCTHEDLQILSINAGSQKFMTSEIFRSLYLQAKVYALFICGLKEGEYKDEMIMLQIFNGLQIQIFNAF